MPCGSNKKKPKPKNKLSTAHKKSISVARKGKPLSDAHKKAIAEGRRKCLEKKKASEKKSSKEKD